MANLFTVSWKVFFQSFMEVRKLLEQVTFNSSYSGLHSIAWWRSWWVVVRDLLIFYFSANFIEKQNPDKLSALIYSTANLDQIIYATCTDYFLSSRIDGGVWITLWIKLLIDWRDSNSAENYTVTWLPPSSFSFHFNHTLSDNIQIVKFFNYETNLPVYWLSSPRQVLSDYAEIALWSLAC